MLSIEELEVEDEEGAVVPVIESWESTNAPAETMEGAMTNTI